MELAHRWADRNLTKLELVTACLIMALLIGYAVRHMLIFFAEVERTMLTTSIVNINSALKYHAAVAIMRGDKQLISRLSEQSPFAVIQSTQGLYVQPADDLEKQLNLQVVSFITQPANYAGELFDPELSEIESGSWYFDLSDKSLNYRIRNDELFQSEPEGEGARIKLKVVIDYNDINDNDRYDADIDEYKSVSLQKVGIYSWLD